MAIKYIILLGREYSYNVAVYNANLLTQNINLQYATSSNAVSIFILKEYLLYIFITFFYLVFVLFHLLST